MLDKRVFSQCIFVHISLLFVPLSYQHTSCFVGVFLDDQSLLKQQEMKQQELKQREFWIGIQVSKVHLITF